MEKLKKLFLLFKTTFLISITANSGYAIISVIRNDFVKKYKWFTEEEMTEYIALLRCKKAANLLKKTNLPIQEISSYVGYSDNNYFAKVFKKNYDMTPTEFRKAT